METFSGTVMMLLSATALFVSLFITRPNPAAIAVSSAMLANVVVILRIQYLERFLRREKEERSRRKK
jgi:hypothetical protein